MPTLKEMEIRLRLSSHGPRLWTRERAAEIRGEAQKKLRKLHPGDVLVLDLKGVEVFDYSFANEFFGKILLNLPHDYPGRFVLVENLTGYTRENLEQALKSLNLLVIERSGKGINLLGKVHPTDAETFKDVLRLRKAATASTLAHRLDVTLTAMNERLNKLVKHSLLRRETGVSEAGREQYEYHTLG